MIGSELQMSAVEDRITNCGITAFPEFDNLETPKARHVNQNGLIWLYCYVINLQASDQQAFKCLFFDI